MAVYAAYRHIELDKIGYGKKRVLKPPGGGTSDIFGATEGVEQSPRRIRNTHHLQSSVFGTNGTSEPPSTPRNKPGNDSHNRLFGPVESGPQSTTKNRMKSNIPFGEEKAGSSTVSEPDSSSKSASAATSVTDVVVENGQQESLSIRKARRNPVTGDGVSSSDSILRRSIKKRDGNPVTGEGYTAANGEKETPSPPASAVTTNGSAGSDPRRSRVPPGGYSSGLW